MNDEDFFDDDGVQIKTKKKRGGIIFLIVICVIAIAALVYGLFFREALSQKISEITGNSSGGINLPGGIDIRDFSFGNESRKSGMYIAQIYVSGVIQKANESYNQEWLLSTIEKLRNDPMNVGILLIIDSPGGTVYEADEAYLALTEYKESGKIVWAYFESLAASGGYYIACAADTIFANRNTLTGSIGVIAGSSIDATEFLEKHGIKTTTFTAGKNKNMLNYNSPLTEEHRQIMQSIADECYDQFVRIVASARKKPISEIREIADGRIYTALQARTNGLIDSIASLADTKEKMTNQAALANGLTSEDTDQIHFKTYEYEYKAPLFNRFMGMFSNQKNPTALADPLTKAALETLAPDINYPAYLYRQ